MPVVQEDKKYRKAKELKASVHSKLVNSVKKVLTVILWMCKSSIKATFGTK